MPTTTYCTVLATNYLPKALALAESVQRHHDAELVVLLIDAEHGADHQLPDLPGVRIIGTDFLGLAREDVLALATYYDLVEFATAIKPLLFRRLLADAEQVFYLDPDTWVSSPMEELAGELSASAGGIVLTPHFLHPLPADAPVNEGHLLTVGVFNLGFCGFDRRALPALDWWWARLEWDCLFDYLSGLFVDQKWMDIGADLFQARSLRHAGYNVGVLNLHERPIGLDEDGLLIASTDERLRLFHFHAFDTSRPDELSARRELESENAAAETPEVVGLCREYAAAVIRHEQALPPAPSYRYHHDTRGRRITRRLRRAWRVQAKAGDRPPSPFLPEHAEAYDAWRHRAWSTVSREMAGDAVKSARMALPEEFGHIKDRFPAIVSGVRSKVVGRGSGMWG
ncbi:hypothetical protein ASE01_05815 [Nocardioides sp. Root190]|uniref:hypothetical protein n=1 Tax=Nocardioides sp. Root190 TaxID=1736488 RepID=UPI0006FE55CE|nr:hypothetical protein [Nocardioides sp. Root190]KRB77718.1 hypothetical protein ASE01_05815 [Nocardioides sp. Root190]